MRNGSMILLLGICGCARPLGLPVVERLEPQAQRAADESWLNMLSPPERLDRLRLLDVLMAGSFYEHGVDRLSFVSEKDVWGGRVVMAVYYDRAQPAFDRFSVVFTDARGQERRREQYTFEEVKNRAEGLFRPVAFPSTQPATAPAEVEAQRRAEGEMADRLARQILIKAATRPAGTPVEASEIAPP